METVSRDGREALRKLDAKYVKDRGAAKPTLSCGHLRRVCAR